MCNEGSVQEWTLVKDRKDYLYYMKNPNLKQQVDSRRTFAIISHPDAGKTTITENLLYFCGAIRQAGTVKGK